MLASTRHRSERKTLSVFRSARSSTFLGSFETKRVQIVGEKEDELSQKRTVEERRLVKLVNDDLKDHIRVLEEQYNVAHATTAKQEEIEKRLKDHYITAAKDLDLAL